MLWLDGVLQELHKVEIVGNGLIIFVASTLLYTPVIINASIKQSYVRISFKIAHIKPLLKKQGLLTVDSKKI